MHALYTGFPNWGLTIPIVIFWLTPCGSCAQYKNYKNFANLIFHVQDFGITAEWNFFATSHGKNLCDGAGGTVKHLATRASLQRPLDNQILTPYQLFKFASQDISGITSFYVNSETIKKTAAILEPWFTKAEYMYQRYQEPWVCSWRE